jgi:hypothetical protein
LEGCSILFSIRDDTILRQLKRGNPVSVQNDTVRVVGIDDWSWRRSSRYGTIMVDLERHSVVDVLEDRSVESARFWLQERPTIEVVSRDRCGLYSQAAREGAPQARQVADRFHLVGARTRLVRNRTFSRESDARHQFSPQNGALDSISSQNVIFSAGVKPREVYTNSVSVRFRTNLVLPPRRLEFQQLAKVIGGIDSSDRLKAWVPRSHMILVSLAAHASFPSLDGR